MLEKLTLTDFEPLIGQKFNATLPEDKTLQFELVDVEELPTGRRRRRQAETPRRAPFSLIFAAPLRLEQGMYSLQHDTFGPDALTIFIVPIAEIEGGFEYEAVFT